MNTSHTVGELAQLAGLTVRALHHYEELGLLVPATRTEAGYRLYGDADIATLHRIVAFQQMGVPLKDIAPLLREGAPPLSAVIGKQLEDARTQMGRQQRLMARLERCQQRLAEGGEAIADELLKIISASRALERWFDEDDHARIDAAKAALSAEDIAHIQRELAELLPAMRAVHASGVAPEDESVRPLARRWIALERHFPTDDAMQEKSRAMLAAERGWQRMTGLTPEVVAYIDRAIAAAR